MAEQPAAGRPAGPVGRVYLDVPYAEKDQAKALGARWDPQSRRWFDPRPPTVGLQRWAGSADVPDVLPGEDRAFGNGLFVDLVPRSCWFTNVRSCVTQQDWERLRRPIFRRAGHRCEACGAAEDRAAGLWLDAHERWQFDDHTGVQSLRRLIALCKPCHLVTHFGYANVTGRTDEALAHLRAVTAMTQPEAWAHVRAAETVWIDRSARVWDLDLTILTGAGVTVQCPEPAAARPAAAERALRQAQISTPASIPAPRPATKDRPPPHQPPAAAPRRGLWTRITGRP